MNKDKMLTALFPETASVARRPADSTLRQYQVVVSCQGSPVAEYIISAADALNAINLVESYFTSEPVTVEDTCIEDAEGRLHKTVLVKNWHGYSFDARALGPC